MVGIDACVLCEYIDVCIGRTADVGRCVATGFPVVCPQMDYSPGALLYFSGVDFALWDRDFGLSFYGGCQCIHVSRSCLPGIRRRRAVQLVSLRTIATIRGKRQ